MYSRELTSTRPFTWRFREHLGDFKEPSNAITVMFRIICAAITKNAPNRVEILHPTEARIFGTGCWLDGRGRSTSTGPGSSQLSTRSWKVKMLHRRTPTTPLAVRTCWSGRDCWLQHSGVHHGAVTCMCIASPPGRGFALGTTVDEKRGRLRYAERYRDAVSSIVRLPAVIPPSLLCTWSAARRGWTDAAWCWGGRQAVAVTVGDGRRRSAYCLGPCMGPFFALLNLAEPLAAR